MVDVRQVSALEVARLLGSWRDGEGSAAGLLADAVERALHDGRLALGVRMPAERRLAEVLGLARGTVASAYRALRAAELITTRTGSGSVTALPPGLRGGLAPWPAGLSLTGGREAALDLTAAEPAAPFDALHAAVLGAADGLPSALAPDGPAAHLRAAIAAAYTDQGLPTREGHVLLTGGADAALALLIAAFVRRGARVVTDSPTYPGALALFRSAGARPVAQPLTGDGWDVAALGRTVAAAGPALTYLVPDFHNPTGLLMDDERRGALRRLLSAQDTLVVVDETLRDLDLRAAAPPPARIAAPGDRRTVTIGSLSKSLWPGLRVGWIRAHPAVIARSAALPVAHSLAPSPLDQLVALRLLDVRAEILDERRRRLRTQRDHLAARLRDLPWCRFALPQGGLSLWLELLDTDADRLTSRAAALGLALTPGHRFSPEGAHHRHLRLPFTLPPDLLDAAVDKLTRAHDTPHPDPS
ncbi:DNA-binding transcriptional MocR family regulator [Actinocorallia herbida]|uniref:DNA-binding transcriptional MocR family regulator n=1 Tax=Actinocorallia herbida TaxID=58109 RepID=A0A3N1D6E8_9ACTN|nr:PLP-dependent aminotransferase family protein [Actinocorallia herbida]ROO89039.1 DNA-binding transcriptional MocR family regulator [Actinocorallia herbida]